jgi:hypothetical protein
MKKKIKFFFFIIIINIFFFQNIYAIEVRKIIKLDKKIPETSGILYLNDQIWTFNDSGGKNELYKIDKNT